MAEENDSTAVDAEAATTRKTSRLARIRRGAVDKPAGKTAPAASVARPAGRTPKASVRGPVRNIATLVIVGGLVYVQASVRGRAEPVSAVSAPISLILGRGDFS